MGWLSRLLGYVSKQERSGISLSHHETWWEVSGFSFPSFLKCLSKLFSDDAVLYLEGTSVARDVREFLEVKKIEHPSKVVKGTIWPRPQIFHIRLTPENVSGLAALAEKHATLEICDHLHVYRDNTVLLEGYDILDCCVSLSGELSESQVKAFCAELQCKYEKVTPDGSGRRPTS